MQQPAQPIESARYAPSYTSAPRYGYDQSREALYERAAPPSYEIPIQRLDWFDRMLFLFGVLELILLVIGFWHAGTVGR